MSGLGNLQHYEEHWLTSLNNMLL